MPSMKRIAVNARVEIAGTEFIVLDWRPCFAHAEQYRTVETGGEYFLMHGRDSWKYWADGKRVEDENPNAARQ